MSQDVLHKLVAGQLEASAESWSSVCDALEVIGPGELLSRADELEHALAGWAHELRFVPNRWCLRWFAGDPHPALRFCRNLHYHRSPDDPQVTVELLERVLHSEAFIPITQLQLANMELGPKAGLVIARCRSAAQLTHLYFYFCRLGDEGVAHLAEGAMSSLRSLTVAHNGSGPQTVKALAHAPWLAELHGLGLRGNQFDVTAMMNLAVLLGEARSLTSLTVSENAVSGKAASTFWKIAGGHAGLKQLSMSKNAIDDRAVEALAKASLPSLVELDLWSNRLTAAGLRALAQAPWITQLTALDVGANPLGDEGVRVLAACPTLGQCCDLELFNCGLGPDAARALAGSPYVAGLRSLSLGSNKIGVAGALAMAASPNFLALEELDLWDNECGEEGKRALESSQHLPRLTKLKV